MNPDKITSILIATYARRLRDLCLTVSQTHGDRLANRWVVPFISQALTSFDPESVKGATVDIDGIRGYSLESNLRQQIQQLQARPEVSLVLGLLGGLPYDNIYGVVRTADQIKGRLLTRAESERNALVQIPSSLQEAEHVKQYFETIRPMQPAEYTRWITDFAGLLGIEFQYLEKLAEFFAGKTRIPIVGGRIKGKLDPLIQEKLRIRDKPDWPKLPQDLGVVSSALLPAYRSMETTLYQKRYC